MTAELGEARETLERLLTLETDECVIWPFSVTSGGYGQAKICGRVMKVHAVALERRVGPRPEGMEAAHGPCHNTRCMNYRHLRWATPRENQADRRRDGTHGLTLTAKRVRLIRRLYARGSWSQRQLAAVFGICHSTVSKIVLGKRWGWA